MNTQLAHRGRATFALALTLFFSAAASAQLTGPKYATLAPTQKNVEYPDVPEAGIRYDVVVGDLEQRVNRLIEAMTTEEKIGQLIQIYPGGDKLSDDLADKVRQGRVGSLFYSGNEPVTREAQRVALEESRLGIPLLIARDVIHGFRTIFPIPLGQAASWNPQLVREAAEVSAMEAKGAGIDWTFAPMVDICRDPRWGRVAETLGEDPHLAGVLAEAMVVGFQRERDGMLEGVAACAKHFVAYGLSEGGRDYNRASLSQADLHNVFLKPFRVSSDAGCRTFMTTFSEVNGIPGTAHEELLSGVLKGSWGFGGFVVSDWGSVIEMIPHGFARDNRDAAELAFAAGVDMDMSSPAFANNLAGLIEEGAISESRLDDAVRRILMVKTAISAGMKTGETREVLNQKSLEVARRLARESVVLLKNDDALPLDQGALKKLAVIGPMADAAQQQLGCWVFDGKSEDSVTPLSHLRERLGDDVEILHAAGARNTFDAAEDGIAEAVAVARQADAVLMFIGEDATLSGEARSRADIDLPGVQSELVRAVAETGTPTILIVLAGRPLTLERELQQADAMLYAWHPGTMTGPAIADLVFGDESPSGKLPITMLKTVGQAPLYYNHSNTGRPSPVDYQPLIGSDDDDLPGQFQYRSHYLDVTPSPRFPFGYGLSYTTFEYSKPEASAKEISPQEEIDVTVTVTNTGDREGVEVVQLYLRDQTARIIRPVRELKGFERVTLRPGESSQVAFRLTAEDIGYLNEAGDLVIEPGEFDVWVGGDSQTKNRVAFTVLPEAMTPTTSLPQSATRR